MQTMIRIVNHVLVRVNTDELGPESTKMLLETASVFGQQALKLSDAVF